MMQFVTLLPKQKRSSKVSGCKSTFPALMSLEQNKEMKTVYILKVWYSEDHSNENLAVFDSKAKATRQIQKEAAALESDWGNTSMTWNNEMTKAKVMLSSHLCNIYTIEEYEVE